MESLQMQNQCSQEPKAQVLDTTEQLKNNNLVNTEKWKHF